MAGGFYLLTQLLAVFLPQTAMWLFAAFFIILFFACQWRCAALRSYACLAMCTVCAALLLRMCYMQLWMRPIVELAGAHTFVTATVLETTPGDTEDTVHATLRVTDCGDAQIHRTFKVLAAAFPDAQMGQKVRFSARLMPLEQDDYLFNCYAKNIYLSMENVQACEWLGESKSLEITGKRIRAAIASNICRYLPGDIGAIASAMAIGDKSRLTNEIKEAFHSAGISHALVVSGLHLGIVCSFLYRLLRYVLHRKWAALGAMIAAVLFAAVTGFTPSIIRAGIAVLLYYGAQLCNRRSDAFTSLGLAALIMCVANPYAVVDIGAMLSFSATLGVLAASTFVTEQTLDTRCAEDSEQGIVQHTFCVWRRKFLNIAIVPVATTLTTLPVLAAAGMGVSVVGILCNLLAIPLLSVIVAGGLILGCWNGSVWLEPLARTAGLACGVCTRLLAGIAQWAHRLPWAVVQVSGAAAVLTILGAAGLLYAGKRLHISLRKNITLAILFVLLCTGIYAVLDREVVRIAAIGNGTEPALVVTNQLHTAVVFRGRDGNIAAVRAYLEQSNRDTVDLVVDLRRTGDTEMLAQQFYARDSIKAEALLNHKVVMPFHAIMITVNHQKGGNYASVDCGGFTVGTSCGKIDLTAYPMCDAYLAGMSEPRNLNCGVLLVPQTVPAWLKENQGAAVLPVQHRRVQQELCFMVRRNQSAVWKGAEHDFS